MIIESKKEVLQEYKDRGGNIYETNVKVGFDYLVDSYVDHRDLNDIIAKRVQGEWDCYKMIECKPTSSGDVVTMFWRK